MTSYPRLLIVAAACLLLVPLGAGAEEDTPTLLGMASGPDWPDDLDAVWSATGRYPAIYQMFRSIDDPNHDWNSTEKGGIRARTQAWLDDIHERGMVPYLEVQVGSEGAFEDFLTGALDMQLHGYVTTISEWLDKGGGRRILIVPFAEANNQKHPWGGDPDRFRAAYEKLRNAFEQEGVSRQSVRFIFGVNGLADLSYDHELNGYREFYPGDDAVDIVGFAKLNRGVPQWRDYSRVFQLHIDEMKETVSRSKPILVIQTGSIASGGDGQTRGDWMDDMFAGLEADPQVIGAIYFNREKEELEDVYDYRVVQDGEVEDSLARNLTSWSDPAEISWIFDGPMDRWVADREAALEAGFSDTVDSIFAADIAWLADEGITRGCNPPVNDRFCPEGPVSRGEMAAFLTRALDLPAGVNGFVDDEGSVFEADIGALAAAGVTRGCNPPVNDRFCPEGPVSRGEMAAFLHRASPLFP